MASVVKTTEVEAVVTIDAVFFKYHKHCPLEKFTLGDQHAFDFFFRAEDGILDVERSRGLGDVYMSQGLGGKERNCKTIAPGTGRCFALADQR